MITTGSVVIMRYTPELPAVPLPILAAGTFADAAPCAVEPVIGPAADPGWLQMVVRLARVRSMPRLSRRGRAVR